MKTKKRTILRQLVTGLTALGICLATTAVAAEPQAWEMTPAEIVKASTWQQGTTNTLHLVARTDDQQAAAELVGRGTEAHYVVPADAMLLVVPVQHMRAVVAALPPDGPPLLVCSKGVEASTHLLPLEILAECLPIFGEEACAL